MRVGLCFDGFYSINEMVELAGFADEVGMEIKPHHSNERPLSDSAAARKKAFSRASSERNR